MRISELEATKQDRLKELDVLLTAKADRDFTEDEVKRFEALEAEVKGLNAKIDLEKRADDLRKQTVINKAAKDAPEAKVAKEYSFQKAISGLMRGKLTGLEAEMSEEAEREMRNAGISTGIQGAGAPSWLLNVRGKNVVGQKRDLTSAGAATGDELVEDNLMGHIYGLNVTPMVAMLGASVMTGLSGDVHFTKTGTVSATWEGETDANAEVTPATSRVSLSPKRLGAFADISKTLLTQTAGFAEAIVRRELETSIRVALDAAAIAGTGAGGQPTGITGLSNVNSVAIGTDGGVPTRAKLIEMETKIAEDNAIISNMAFLTTPGIRGYLKALATDTGSGLFVWGNDNNLVGYGAYASNNVPSTLTKGASSGNCHAIILGCWDQLLIGQWGGIDLVVNPYTRAKENILEVVINTNWDIDARYDQAFCVILDAKTS